MFSYLSLPLPMLIAQSLDMCSLLMHHRRDANNASRADPVPTSTGISIGYPIDVSADPVGYPSRMSYGCSQDILMSSPMDVKRVYIHRTSKWNVHRMVEMDVHGISETNVHRMFHFGYPLYYIGPNGRPLDVYF